MISPKLDNGGFKYGTWVPSEFMDIFISVVGLSIILQKFGDSFQRRKKGKNRTKNHIYICILVTLHECDSSDHPVSVLVVVNILTFLTSSFKLLHRFASNFVWMFLGETLPRLLKLGCYPYFSWNYG